MKTIILISILFIVTFKCFSQDSSTISTDIKKENYSLNMGTMYSSFTGNSFGSSYINPVCNYQFSPKMSLNMGGFFMNTNQLGSKMASMGMSQGFGSNAITSGMFYLGGKYKINSKLTIAAMGYKGMGNNEGYKIGNVFMSQFPNSFDSKMAGMNLGFNYKLSNNVSIGGSFNLSNRSNYSYSNYYSPYSNHSMFDTPFNNNSGYNPLWGW